MMQNEHNELPFHLMVSACPNAMILVNDKGNIAFVNDYAEKLFGYDRNELIGRNLEILIPIKFSRSHSLSMESYLKNLTKRHMGENRELFAVKKGGVEFPVEIGLNPIITVDGTMILASIIDITERKKTEKQFQLIVESAPNAIILVNSEGIIELANEQAKNEFGYAKEELIGKKIELLIPGNFKNKHVDLRDNFMLHPTKRAMGAGRSLSALRKDGTEFPAEVGLNPLNTEKGVQILVSIINITERVKLENIVNDNTIKIEAQNQQLKELNATKDKLLSIIAHDLKSPISSLIAITDILDADYNAFSDDTKKNMFSQLNKSAKTTFALLDNLLNWALSQQGRIVINKVETNLNEFIQETISPYLTNSEKKKINIQIDIPKDQNLFVDKHTMGVVIANITNNAIKFTPEGGSVHILSTRKPDQTEIRIEDNGVGMNQTQISNLFKIEKSSSKMGTNNEKGSGLGLILCKEFVEQNGGNIRIESDMGKGSTFKITIPNKFDD